MHMSRDTLFYNCEMYHLLRELGLSCVDTEILIIAAHDLGDWLALEASEIDYGAEGNRSELYVMRKNKYGKFVKVKNKRLEYWERINGVLRVKGADGIALNEKVRVYEDNLLVFIEKLCSEEAYKTWPRLCLSNLL